MTPALPFRPRAVVFDMDGLMLDSERTILGCLDRAAREHGCQIEFDFWVAMVGQGDAACRRLLAGRVGDTAADTILQRCHVLYDEEVARGIAHRPGIVELLRWLGEAGLPRAVATSTRRPLALRKLEAAGLLQHFDVVCTSSDVAAPKPAPDVYLLAARKLGVAPEDCVVLEDSPTGVRAALAAGMTPIQVPDMLLPDEQVRALGHRIIGSLAEVRPLLEPSLRGP